MPLDPPFLLAVEELRSPRMGTELVAPLLYALVRSVRPASVLEVGAGYTTAFLARALADNAADDAREREELAVGEGGLLRAAYFQRPPRPPRLRSVDLDEASAIRAVLARLELDGFAGIHRGDFRGFAAALPEDARPIDFAWFDCGGPREYVEFLAECWPLLAPGGLLAFHHTYWEMPFVDRGQCTSELVAGSVVNELKRQMLRAGVHCDFEVLSAVEPHKSRQGSLTLLRKLERTARTRDVDFTAELARLTGAAGVAFPDLCPSPRAPQIFLPRRELTGEDVLIVRDPASLVFERVAEPDADGDEPVALRVGGETVAELTAGSVALVERMAGARRFTAEEAAAWSDRGIDPADLRDLLAGLVDCGVLAFEPDHVRHARWDGRAPTAPIAAETESAGWPARELLARLALDAAAMPHSAGTLLDHLRGTHAILAGWAQSRAMCLAGLFHSVYATDAYPDAAFSISRRAEVQALVGGDAEALVFLFATVDRADLCRRLRRLDGLPPDGLDATNWRTGELCRIGPARLAELLLLEIANLAEQAREPGGEPSTWMGIASHWARLAGPWCSTPAPIFGFMRASLSEADDRAALTSYRLGLAERSADHLRRAVDRNPWAGEPSIALAELLGARDEARIHAQRGVQRLLEWGTSWDKRDEWRRWLSRGARLLTGPASPRAGYPR